MINAGSELAGRYRLESRIAQGGMGDIYAGQDLERDRPVAVKVLRGTSPEDLHRFESEAQLLRRIDHDNVVRMLDTGDVDGTPYIVMDLVEGPSLRDVLREGPLSVDEAARVGRHIAAALAAAHEHGVVHRDVKPANVLMDSDRRAYLSDFGIARLQDVTGITRTGVTMGTAAYLAPEQLGTEGVGPPADIYALGLVLIETFNGEPVFVGTTSEAALARLHRDPEIPEGIDEAWEQLLRMMTARLPERRPTAGAVAAALSGSRPVVSVLGDGSTAPLAIPQDVTPAPPVLVERDDGPTGAAHVRVRRRTVVGVAAAVGAVVLAAAIVLVWLVNVLLAGAAGEDVTEPTEPERPVVGEDGADAIPDTSDEVVARHEPALAPEPRPVPEPQAEPERGADGGGDGTRTGPGNGPDGLGPPGRRTSDAPGAGNGPGRG